MSLLDDIKDLPRSVWGKYSDNEINNMVRRGAQQARQFVFNLEASRTVGRFIHACPDILADQVQFAIPPYDHCYIEVELHDLLVEASPEIHYDRESKVDLKVGFLFYDNLVFTLASNVREPHAQIAAFGTMFKNGLHRLPESKLIESKFKGRKQVAMTELMLGTTCYKLTEEQRNVYRDRFTVFHTIKSEYADDDKLADILNTYTGETRILVALLLMLYNKKHLRLSDRPFERRITKHGMRTYMAHTTVEISLTDPVEIRRAFGSGHGSPKRRHEVRTHYAHKRIAMRCEHEWVRRECAENEQWECSKCGGLRFLKRQHLRGDGTIGFVTKKYVVTP